MGSTGSDGERMGSDGDLPIAGATANFIRWRSQNLLFPVPEEPVMTDDPSVPARRRTPQRYSRRSVLTWSALAALGASALTACERPGLLRAGASGSPDAGASGAATGTASALSGASAPLDWQELDAHVLGHHLTVRVSPLIRNGEDAAVLVLEITRAADDSAVVDVDAIDPKSYSDNDKQNVLSLSVPLGGTDPFRPGRGADGTRLLDLDAGRVWCATTGTGVFLEVRPGETVTSYVAFGAVDVESVIAFVPQADFVAVRVIGRDDAAGLGIDFAAMDKELKKQKPESSLAAPVAIERYTRAIDGSTATLATDKDVTVTLSSDVTFDSDSYNLTAAADSQLQTVADQIAQHPDGGSLDIVGHTDDVADDAHNQKLSEDRAGAVKDRLGQLADLAKWKVSTTGKGESEPAVKDTTDEARAANRRVVITITPTGGAASSTAPSATPSSAPSAAPSSSAPGGTALPEPQGQVGAGPDGVTAVYPSIGSFDSSEQVTITLPQVVRAGGLLFGRLSVTVGPRGADDNSVLSDWFDDDEFLLSNARGEDGSLVATIGAVNGLTLLAGGERVFPADYLDGDRQVHLPLSECNLFKSLKEGAVTTVCAVWPDTGQETVTLDHQAYKDDPWHAFRLTDIPVVSA
mgnify:FL=1